MNIDQGFLDLAKAAEAAGQPDLQRQIRELHQAVMGRRASMRHRVQHALVPVSSFAELLESSHQDLNYRQAFTMAVMEAVKTITEEMTDGGPSGDGSGVGSPAR